MSELEWLPAAKVREAISAIGADVEVPHRQQFRLARGEPFLAATSAHSPAHSSHTVCKCSISASCGAPVTVTAGSGRGSAPGASSSAASRGAPAGPSLPSRPTHGRRQLGQINSPLAGRLRRAQTFLRTLGIEIAYSREGRLGTRMIRVSTSTKHRRHRQYRRCRPQQ